jgi:hypothetical protein
MSAQCTAINVTGTGTAYPGACTYRGFWISSTGTPTVTIYDGTSAAGTVLAQFTLAANGWAADDVSDGLRCSIGIFVSVSAGSIAGHVRVG